MTMYSTNHWRRIGWVSRILQQRNQVSIWRDKESIMKRVNALHWWSNGAGEGVDVAHQRREVGSWVSRVDGL